MRAIARFFFWYHLKATLWTSGVIALIAALNELRLISASLKSFFAFGGQTYQTISAILGPIGLLALFVFAFSFVLNRRRRFDGPPDNDRMVNH